MELEYAPGQVFMNILEMCVSSPWRHHFQVIFVNIKLLASSILPVQNSSFGRWNSCSSKSLCLGRKNEINIAISS